MNIEAKLIALAAAILLLFGMGWAARGVEADRDAAHVKLAYMAALNTVRDAKDKAEAHAVDLEHNYNTKLAIATTTYEEKHETDKAAADQRVADLTARITSLRVRLATIASSGSTVRDPAAATGGSDGETTATLDPAVAGRLARRYAEYNEIVEQLNLCQSVIEIDRQQ